MTTASSAFAEEVSGIAIPKAASAAKAMANLRIEFPPSQHKESADDGTNLGHVCVKFPVEQIGN
jgi:hypothetical protein